MTDSRSGRGEWRSLPATEILRVVEPDWADLLRPHVLSRPSGARHLIERDGAMSAQWVRTIRTVVQVVVGVAVMVPVIVQATGLTVDQAPWLAGVVGVSAVVARVMQSAPVEAQLERWGLQSVSADGGGEG